MTYRKLILCMGFLLGIFTVLGLTVQSVNAHNPLYSTDSYQQDGGDGNDEDEEPLPEPSTEYCLLCHAETDEMWTLPSGETLALNVDVAVLDSSVHGSSNPDIETSLECSDCHVNYRYPHPRPTVQNVREFVIERYASCRTCHEDQYLHAQDSVHGEALRDGHLEVAVCIDCHGGHDIPSPHEPRENISITCGQCHGAIFEEYSQSIHGEDLFTEGNEDVPTCVDCHGVHDIDNPVTTSFRTRSPEICADCHANEKLMDKYDISTNVFDSYLTDFHGSTVAFFEQEDPDVPTNKAVCYDCHGVHNIKAVDHDTIRENLLPTCQQCHPGADANFPDAWVGHYEPTMASNPLLVLSEGLYNILVVFVVGGSGFLIVTDILRRILRRSR